MAATRLVLVGLAGTLAAALVSGCGGGTETTQPGGGQQGGGGTTANAIAIGTTPAALTVSAGGAATAAVSIGRSTGFTGAVTLSLDSPPAGISATFASSPTTTTSATMTINVASSVTAGAYTLTLKGAASGVADKTATIALTVTSAQPVGFSVSVDPAEFELPAGKGWNTTGFVTVTRANGFTGPVTLSATGLAGTGGAIGGPSPATIAAGSTMSNLTILTLDGSAPGVYTGTVKASGAGFGDQVAQVRVRISAPSTGNITWKYCNASRVPRYFAVRDGNGAWQHVVPGGPAAATAANPATYSFSLSSATATIATITLGEKTSPSPLIEGYDWKVYSMTRQEIIDQGALECVRYPDASTRRATSTVTGYAAFDAVIASASQHAIANTGSTGQLTTTLSLSNLQPGPFDLLLSRYVSSGNVAQPFAVGSVVLKRGLDPAAGGAITPINFASDGVAPASGTVTFGNANGADFFTVESFLTDAGLNGQVLALGAISPTTRTWYGLPSSALVAGDLHQLVATTNVPSARRAVIAYQRTVSSRALDFGPALTPPSVTAGASGASPWIVRATGTLSSDYVTRASMYLREQFADPRTMTILATRGGLGGTNAYDIVVPDLSAAVGFTSFWNFHRGITVAYTVTGGEGDPGGPNEAFCMVTGVCPVKAVDGAVYRSAQATGTVVVP